MSGNASPEVIADLQETLGEAAADLSRVVAKKMFGCHALFAGASIFALVWKEGEIGLRLPIKGDFEKAMELPGSKPWKAGPMTMAHWVLLSDEVSSDKPRFTKWVRRAHEIALRTPPEKKGGKKAAKKVAPAKKESAPAAKGAATKKITTTKKKAR